MQSSKISDYDVISIMGTGSFGTCYKVKNKRSNDIYVWKSIDYNNLTEDKKYLIINEINLLRELNHPNIVHYYDHINHSETKTIFIIMECCEGGDLSKLIQRCTQANLIFEEPFIWRVLYQISKALHYCHLFRERKCIILHRDIKPANIFLDTNGNVKLGDFGVARILTERDNFETETMVGTPHYMSPEITKGVKYNKKSDIWSLGCLVYEMCALTPPFVGKKFNELFQNINSGIFSRIPALYSDDLNQIIKFMLTVDNDIRPSIEMVLHHPKVISNQTGNNTGYPKLVSNQIYVNDFNFNFTSTLKRDSGIKDDGSDFSFETKSTPELKKELFQSARRKIFENSSDSEFHRSRSVAREPRKPLSLSDNLQKLKITRDPDEITQEIFNEALRKRLQSIRAHESLMQQKEDDLKKRENQLIMREQKMLNQNERLRRSRKSLRRLSPPHHKLPVFTNSADDTNVTIEPNDTVVQPTVAKIDPQKLQRPKTLQNRVKFDINRNRENIPPSDTVSHKSHATSSSSGSANFNNQLKYNYRDLEEAVQKKFAKQTKRRSIFSLLFSSNTNPVVCGKTMKKTNSLESVISVPANSIAATSCRNIHVTENSDELYDINTKWTRETKKTAFEMLALLNSANDGGGRGGTCESRGDSGNEIFLIDDKIVRRDNKRKSMIVYKKHTDL